MSHKKPCKNMNCEGCNPTACPKAYSSCPAYKKAERRAWNEKNGEKQVEYRRNPRAVIGQSLRNHALRGQTVEVTTDEAFEIYQANNGKCKYCGRQMSPSAGLTDTSLTLDRINNESVLRRDNIQFICKQCNVTKGKRTHDEFIAYIKAALGRVGNE